MSTTTCIHGEMGKISILLSETNILSRAMVIIINRKF